VIGSRNTRNPAGSDAGLLFFFFTPTTVNRLRRLQELKQINYSLDVQLKREQEERQKIERQLMALYGSRGQYTPPPGPAAASAASGAASANHSPGRLVRLNTADDFYHHETSDLSNCKPGTRRSLH